MFVSIVIEALLHSMISGERLPGLEPQHLAN
jgi:hypothetical protein